MIYFHAKKGIKFLLIEKWGILYLEGVKFEVHLKYTIYILSPCKTLVNLESDFQHSRKELTSDSLCDRVLYEWFKSKIEQCREVV